MNSNNIITLIHLTNQLDYNYKYVEDNDDYPEEALLTTQEKIELKSKINNLYMTEKQIQQNRINMWQGYYKTLIDNIEIAKFKIDNEWSVSYFNKRFIGGDLSGLANSGLDIMVNTLEKILNAILPYLVVQEIIEYFCAKLQYERVNK